MHNNATSVGDENILWACLDLVDMHVLDNKSTPGSMLKKSALLTRPTLAR